MRKVLIPVLMITLATTAFGQQIRTPRVSPKSTLTQTVGLTDITVNYSRPGVKGRTIWGGLVPYDQVWRTGANEATTISFSDDVMVEGQKLAKGTYSLHTIPGRDEWTVIFNSVADQWGSYSYDAAKDTLRVKVKPQQAEHREWLTFEIPDMTTDTATLMIRWANTAVPVKIDTQSTARTMAQFRDAMKADWRTPYMAANFAFENKGAATDAEINAWLEESLKINQNIGNLWLRARVAERAGNKAEAIRYAEMAVAAPGANPDFANEIKKSIAKWKGQ